jgi:hypothetical protein
MRAVSISVKEKNEIPFYTVKWQKEPNGEEMQCRSSEFPRPELISALSGFGEFIPIMCMIPKEHIRYVIIAGATFVYKDKNVGLYLGVEMELTNGYVFDFKTPVRRLDIDNPDLQQSTNWEDRYTKLAMKLGEEILLYAQGKRAQQNLEFAEENSNSKELATV